ncbi:MAG TPA: hypothetical protein VLG92_00640 [Candidatus Saccharimonadia bacterium]|nr:hypothetical protein [Candidatus Saccharimonadia bacterium]
MLFGHQNDDANQSTQMTPATPTPGVNPLAVDPDTGASLPVAPAEPPMPPETNEPSVLNQPTASAGISLPATDMVTSGTDNTDITDAVVPTSAPAMPTSTDEGSAPFTQTNTALDTASSMPSEPTSAPEPTFDTQAASAPAEPSPSSPLDSNLLSLKQQALAQLEPLVDQLDQTPEEKFRTTMMLIQSTDNHGLIQDAYATAQSITDEKVRAQALLDVINEINYFTQQSKD